MIPCHRRRNLDESHSRLSQATRQQALPRKLILAVSDAVQLANTVRFVTQFEYVWHFALHSECQLEGLDRALNLRVKYVTLELVFIETANEVELSALYRAGHAGILYVLH